MPWQAYYNGASFNSGRFSVSIIYSDEQEKFSKEYIMSSPSLENIMATAASEIASLDLLSLDTAKLPPEGFLLATSPKG